VAQGFAELGVSAGDRVALWLPNSLAWLAAYFACARLGAIAVAVNTRFRSAEIADIVGRSGAKLLVLWPDFRHVDFLGILADVDAAALDRLVTVVAYGGVAPAVVAGKPAVAYGALTERPPYAADHGGRGVGSAIFTTSGTTKAPKFVLHNQASVVDHAHWVARSFGYAASDTILLQSLPLCGVFGFSQAMAALFAGVPIVMQPSFAAAEAVVLIDRYGVTALNGTDELFARVLAERPGERPFPTLRSCFYAAFNPTLDKIVPEAEARGLRLAGLFGASEVQALFARQNLEAPVEVRNRPGGFPVGPGYAVRVRDPESGRLLPPGESGELELSGPSRMAGYFGDELATAKAITEDGWVRSGDLGRLVGDGSFVFETRMGDVLRLSGYLVAPSEIEAYVQTHPGIEGCQAVGAVGESGLAVVAFVTLRPGAAFDETALKVHCAAGLARFKVPARIVALDAFPTTPGANGTKVQRVKLRDMAQQILSGAP
jgi:fatty-acyl-CoA synthase